MTQTPEQTYEQTYLTITQFAKAIGVHTQTLRGWDRNNKLKPHHRMPGGKRLYSEEQVSEFLNNKMSD